MTNTDLDEIHYPLTVALEYGNIVITCPYVEYSDQDGHDCRCEDIHKPGPGMGDGDVITLDAVEAVELVVTILKLALPLPQGSESDGR
jgi:hypothetical protein